MVGHPRTARTGEMVEKARLLTNRREWAQRAFESVWFSHQIITLGGQTSCSFDQGGVGGGGLSAPRKASKGRWGGAAGEINASEKKSDPSDVTVMLILDLVFKQIRWVEYTSTTANKTRMKVREIKEQRQFQLRKASKEEKKYFILVPVSSS